MIFLFNLALFIIIIIYVIYIPSSRFQSNVTKYLWLKKFLAKKGMCESEVWAILL